jgi:hypothetical protein
MMTMGKLDAILHVRFLTTAENGRDKPIVSDKYGCPVMIDERGYDCRFVLSEIKRFELGNSYDIAVKFMCPDIAKADLYEGADISLWEGKTIAKGKVIKIVEDTP